MSEPLDWIPPRHGEDEHWGSSEPVPVCPECGGLVRAERLVRKGPNDPERGDWRCDLHSVVVPEWVYEKEEEP